jgi:hypothetical protein
MRVPVDTLPRNTTSPLQQKEGDSSTRFSEPPAAAATAAAVMSRGGNSESSGVGDGKGEPELTQKMEALLLRFNTAGTPLKRPEPQSRQRREYQTLATCTAAAAAESAVAGGAAVPTWQQQLIERKREAQAKQVVLNMALELSKAKRFVTFYLTHPA